MNAFLAVVGSFLLGYIVCFYLTKDFDNDSSPEKDIRFNILNATLDINNEPVSDIEAIYEISNNTTAGEWYLEPTKMKNGVPIGWDLKATHTDGGIDHAIASFISNYPEDVEFLVNARNTYIPELIEDIHRLNTNISALRIYVESVLLNSKNTAEDYKKILNSIIEKL